jgi:hypothetical protein
MEARQVEGRIMWGRTGDYAGATYWVAPAAFGRKGGPMVAPAASGKAAVVFTLLSLSAMEVKYSIFRKRWIS